MQHRPKNDHNEVMAGGIVDLIILVDDASRDEFPEVFGDAG
jgi:hypothetical protein